MDVTFKEVFNLNSIVTGARYGRYLIKLEKHEGVNLYRGALREALEFFIDTILPHYQKSEWNALDILINPETGMLQPILVSTTLGRPTSSTYSLIKVPLIQEFYLKLESWDLEEDVFVAKIRELCTEFADLIDDVAHEVDLPKLIKHDHGRSLERLRVLLYTDEVLRERNWQASSENHGL